VGAVEVQGRGRPLRATAAALGGLADAQAGIHTSAHVLWGHSYLRCINFRKMTPAINPRTIDKYGNPGIPHAVFTFIMFEWENSPPLSTILRALVGDDARGSVSLGGDLYNRDAIILDRLREVHVHGIQLFSN